MLKIGITGGIGSGKTMVCHVIEQLGFNVFYSDLEAKKLMHESESLKNSICMLLGKQSYHLGKLNKKHISAQIFKYPALREGLNKLVHPEVYLAFENWCLNQKTKIVFNESALLFETGSHTRFDKTILVTASKETRIKRIQVRDKLPYEAILQRMNTQLDDETKKLLADFEIQNNENQMIVPQLIEIINKL